MSEAKESLSIISKEDIEKILYEIAVIAKIPYKFLVGDNSRSQNDEDNNTSNI